MESKIKIKEYDFNENGLNTISAKYINWPVVYLINSDDKVYIGETSNIKERMKQHLNDPNKKSLKKIHIIYDETFNKSATLDIEQNLISMFYSDDRFDANKGILNKNNGQSAKHNYYQREMYLNKLKYIWEALQGDELEGEKLTNKLYKDIVNSNIYKYSPFTSLTNEQENIMCEIINNILDLLEGKSDNTTSIITGLAGTGKTVLAVNLIYNIANENFACVDTYKEEETENISEYDKTIHRLRNYILNNGKIKIGFVVPMRQLRKTLRTVFNSVNRRVLKGIIIGPGGVVKNDYDLIICDETHRLSQYKNISHMGDFKKKCRKLGIDEKTSTQLDWINMKSKYKVLFYDGNQTVKGSDIPKEKMDEIIQKNSDKLYNLTTQLRCRSGELFLENIDKLFDCSLKSKIESSKDFEIKVFNNPNKMIEKIKKLDDKMGLCRNVAGFDWEWKTQHKSYEEIEEKGLFDIELGKKKYIWNHKRDGWIISDNAVNEIGCIHTVQGYDLNYVGVIIGPSLDYNKETNQIEIDIEQFKDINAKRATKEEDVKKYIINAYKVLLERGIKGCYIYACNENMQEYLKKYIEVYSD